MNVHESTCHPGDGTKGLNRLPYLAEALRQFDLQQELHELDRRIRGAAKPGAVRGPWQSNQTSASFWSS